MNRNVSAKPFCVPIYSSRKTEVSDQRSPFFLYIKYVVRTDVSMQHALGVNSSKGVATLGDNRDTLL